MGAPDSVDADQLWSWVDRGDPRLEAHLRAHPEDSERVAALRAAVASLRAGASAVPPERIGPYEIVRVLGEGAMGVVYEALQPSPRRRVALKVLRRGALDDARAPELLAREAAALARLSHPGIAVIHEAGRSADGHSYLVMELVEGVSLVAYAREHALDRRARVRLLAAVCSAVQHAHARGVVHRDLKPSNVLVVERGDAAGQPKVLDFGLARLADAGGATLSGTVLGTPAYMSPEQALGRPAGPASDVYALGVMLYELVTGALPIELSGTTLVEAVRRIAETPARSPSRWVPGLERELEAVLMRCLEKDPTRRYADAGALADELGRWLEGRPVLARTSGLAERAWRGARRHKVGVFASLVVALFAALAGFAILFPAELPWELTGNWWKEGSPFEALRWRGDVPEVELDGRWYELRAIEDLDAAYVTGFCRQYAGERWRKRFSEDLVQVLNRMRVWRFGALDLLLRDLETGELVRRADVPLDRKLRQRIYRDRDLWPFEGLGAAPGGILVSYLGRAGILVSLEGVAIGALELGPRVDGDLSNLYDEICEHAGRSPRARIDFVLADPESGARTEFRSVPRDGETVLAERASD
jgi:hypothetical protein